MFKWIVMATRNIFKNRRRSFVTIMAIAIGFASINLFYGYVDNTYEGLTESAIRGEGLGHLTIYKKGWNEHGKNDPDQYMFSSDEVNLIINLIQENKNVLLLTPQLFISGMVSNGNLSQIFLANGVVPNEEEIIRGDLEDVSSIQGQGLTKDKPYGVEMSKDLAKNLKLEPGSEAVVMTTTLDGQMNALDIQVLGIYETGSTATNDKFMRVTFDFARSLYDTLKADKIVVLLKDGERLKETRERILLTLNQSGILCEIKDWQELSVFFSQVKNMFDLLFMFIFIIVLNIVTMSVINTMSMAVIERTREIGVLRAIGFKQSGISLLFSIEGVMLGVIGSALGAFFTLVVWLIIHVLEPSYVPPGNSSAVPLRVNLVPEAILAFVFFIICLTLLASKLSARKASRLNIVDALGHV